MADLDRVVGGLRCRDVLGLLADYVDGELDSAMAESVDEHLRGCDACEKFGGEYAALVARLRSTLLDPRSDGAPHSGLMGRMRRVWEEEGRPSR